MLALLLAIPLGGTDAESDLRALRRKEEPAYLERSLAISRELLTLGEDPWAGVYGYSNEIGSNQVLLAPRAGAAFGWHGCVGIQRLNHGEIRNFGADWVEVEWKIDPALDSEPYFGKPHPRLSSKLLVIPWGREHYLVPEGRLMEFVNAVNARDPDLVSAFWRRGANESMRLRELEAGMPDVPDSVRSCLLESLVVCRCTGAWDKPDPHPIDVPRIWRELAIDTGNQPKLRVGMCLYAGSRLVAGEIMEVVDRFARVEFRTCRTEADRWALDRGIELTTRPPKR